MPSLALPPKEIQSPKVSKAPKPETPIPLLARFNKSFTWNWGIAAGTEGPPTLSHYSIPCQLKWRTRNRQNLLRSERIPQTSPMRGLV